MRSNASSRHATPARGATTGGGGGGGGKVSGAGEEDALDLGIKLMQGFARKSKTAANTRVLKPVFAVWRVYCETIKKNTMYAMRISNLMRRSLTRRHLYQWRDVVLQARDMKGRTERLAGRLAMWDKRKSYRCFRVWMGMSHEKFVVLEGYR